MSKRDKFIARLKSQLDEWTAELRELEYKAEQAGANVGHKYRQAIDELREKRADAETKLEQVKHAGEETWEDIKDEAERAWTAFKAGVDAFRDFSDHS